MSGKVEATFHGTNPDPQTAQQLAVARAYVARVNECPYQHTHTSLYCSTCGWFAESPIMALVAEVDRLAAGAPPVRNLADEQAGAMHDDHAVWLPAVPMMRNDLEGLEQHYVRTTDPGNGLDAYLDYDNGRRIPEYEAQLKVRAKRLSEAEMAVELYRAEWTVLHVQMESHELLKRAFSDDPFWTCGFAKIPQDDLDKVATIRRFAEHPHHDAAPRFTS